MKVSAVIPWSGSTEHLFSDFVNVIDGIDEVVIIDDASDPLTENLLRVEADKQGWILERNNLARGFSYACNQGFRAATGEIVVFLNSDITLGPRIAGDNYGNLAAALKNEVKDGSLYGPSLMLQIVYGMGCPYLEGWCVAASRSTWQTISLSYMYYDTYGPWDVKNYPGPYWEDVDLSFRALQHQPKITLVPTNWMELGLIAHKGGETIGTAMRYGESFENNRATFAAKVKPIWKKWLKQ